MKVLSNLSTGCHCLSVPSHQSVLWRDTTMVEDHDLDSIKYSLKIRETFWCGLKILLGELCCHVHTVNKQQFLLKHKGEWSSLTIRNEKIWTLTQLLQVYLKTRTVLDSISSMWVYMLWCPKSAVSNWLVQVGMAYHIFAYNSRCLWIILVKLMGDILWWWN